MKCYQYCDVRIDLTDAIWRLLVGGLNFDWNTNQGDLIGDLSEPGEVLSSLTVLASEKCLGIDLTGFVSFDWIGIRKIFRNRFNWTRGVLSLLTGLASDKSLGINLTRPEGFCLF